ncbi:glycosyltransferase [Ascidiimonas sp. W6]|uniref:glycosyltransferase n=1 Tax=Ascidiimonas meishanensis TaxID=3128903 RepID=UPI0030EB8B2C
MNYGIIIPCFNEEKRLQKKVFKEFIKTHQNYHLCFVNDGSKDNTLKVLKQLKEESAENISILNLSLNKGKSFAILEGTKHLYLNHKLDQLGFLDADLSTSLDEYHQMNQQLENTANCDFICGTRGENTKIVKSYVRKVISGTAKYVIRTTFGLPFEDTQCGAKIFKAAIIPYIFNKPFLSKWLFDIELFIRCINKTKEEGSRGEIHQFELKDWQAVGESRLRKRDFVLAFKDISAIYFAYRFRGIDLKTDIKQLQFEPMN